MHYTMLFNPPLKRWRTAGDSSPLSGAMSEPPCNGRNLDQTSECSLPIKNHSSADNATLQTIYEWLHRLISNQEGIYFIFK